MKNVVRINMKQINIEEKFYKEIKTQKFIKNKRVQIN